MDRDDLGDGLGDRLTQLLTTYDVPGAQVGLLRRGERTVVCRGSSDLEGRHPAAPGTAFHAGSLAKSLTGLVVLDAARGGELDLDVPCRDQADATSLWDDTPRALLTQTTGRANLLPDLDEDLADFVARVEALPRVHAPGRFSYGNAGWSVLDLLLHRRTGSGFEERATTLLEEALGWRPDFGPPAGASLPHAVTSEGQVAQVPSDYSAAASAAGSRWWATADQLLDWAAFQLAPPDGWQPLVEELRRPAAPLPGSTVFDAWASGWAVWDRGAHRAFGWAGFTGGHRAYLRCFPEQHAALVVLVNAAGPLFGPPGGSALFDDLLPEVLDTLGVPPLAGPAVGATSRPTVALAGQYGPMAVTAVAGDEDLLEVDARFVGQRTPVTYRRHGGDLFDVAGAPPGSTPLSFDDDLAYLGPFALPRL